MRPIRAALLAASLAIAASAAGSQGAAPTARSADMLVPLTNADEESTSETGCTSAFSIGIRDYLQLVGNELMLRDRDGLHACRLTEASTQALENARGAVVCSRYRLQVWKFGRTDSNAETDSSSTRATLTTIRDGRTATMRGRWGVAC